MITVDRAINRVRRDLTLATLLKFALGLALAGCFMVGPDNLRFLAIITIGSLWFWLSLNSARGSRVAAASPVLIAAGNYEEAERNIERVVRTFSLFRNVKLQALHHLAVLRHAQHRWQESATLAKALLGQRLGALQPINISTRLLLADALLEMNDMTGVYETLSSIRRDQLSLGEMLKFQTLEVEYCTNIAAWDVVMDHVMNRVRLTELMPAGPSGRTQAMIALAALKRGKNELSTWLKSRAELLIDVPNLLVERPALRELWP
jgi:hypothetical protein